MTWAKVREINLSIKIFVVSQVNFELEQVKGVDMKLIDAVHTTLIKKRS
jgi:hypothetical protein